MRKTLKMMQGLLAFVMLMGCSVSAVAADIPLKTGGKMEVFRPAADKACGRAIVLCPGGG